ncbi:hypothetical protein FB107DRAFT_189387, partial [Schizophyllum commune]
PGGGPPGGGPPGGGPPGGGPPGGGPPGGGPPGGGPPGGPPGGGGPPFMPPMGGAGLPSDAQTWQINHKLSTSVVPKWDGKGHTLINYLIELLELARLSEDMKKGLAQWAPQNWTGDAKSWWLTLSIDSRDLVSSSWETFLTTLRHRWMTDDWVQDRRKDFESMEFRKGWENAGELPRTFLQRRIRVAAILFPHLGDSWLLVYEVLRTIPQEWRSVLNHQNQQNIYELEFASEIYQDSLLSLYRVGRLTRPRAPEERRPRFQSRRRANAAEVEVVEDSEGEAVGASLSSDDPALLRDSDEEEEREVHAVQKGGKDGQGKKKIGWPHGTIVNNYHFKRDDSVVTNPKPRGNCFICTSPNHHAARCPHYGMWDSLRAANLVWVDPEDLAEVQRECLAVHAAYNANESAYEEGMLDKRETSSERDARVLSIREGRLPANRNERRRSDESVRKSRAGKARDDSLSEDPNRKDRRLAAARLRRSVAVATSDATSAGARRKELAQAEEVEPSEGGNPSTSRFDKVFPAPRARSHPAGYNALDTNALTLPVRIGSPRGEQTHGRMDSGADITLMSEEFFEKVGTLPPYKEGLRMKLYHLTGSAKVLGFTTFTMYARTKTKELVSFEVEAYVVRDMKVPLLLGEDF